MAHTLRGVFNHYFGKGIVVDIHIMADMANAILPLSSTAGATGFLRTHMRQRQSSDGADRDRVTAWIYIHRNANRHLARICIAHEIAHLIMELDAYIDGRRREWLAIKVDSAIEGACDVFARRLCGYHDRFNRDEALRDEFIYFPTKMFEEVLKTNSTHGHLKWPAGLELDPAHAFHIKRAPGWLD
jgi:hypothetical protein